MRAAQQGVPVASLPSAPSGGGLLSGLFGGSDQRAPLPTAPVQPTASAARTANGSGGLDGWLLNNLFGRR